MWYDARTLTLLLDFANLSGTVKVTALSQTGQASAGNMHSYDVHVAHMCGSTPVDNIYIYTSQKECLCIFSLESRNIHAKKSIGFSFSSKGHVQVPAVRFSLCSWPSQCDHEALPSSCDEGNPSPNLFSRNPGDLQLTDKILHHQGWWLSHYLKGFNHPRWCRISSINSSSSNVNHPLVNKTHFP